MQIRLDPETEEKLVGVLRNLAGGENLEASARDLRETYGDGARAWVEDAMKGLPARIAKRRAGLAGFETRLIARWGGALDIFEYLLQTCQEIGRDFDRDNRIMAVERQDQKFEAMSRLHAKGVLTASEILTLLRTGHSTAAMARWRTLHEAAVTAFVLAPEDPDIARRYLMHRVVESYRAQRDYERFWSRLNVQPPDWTPSERDETRRQLVEEFGSDFLKPYGWAEPLFARVPTFRDLEERAALDHLRPYYRMASHGIHPSGQGVLWSLQSSGERDVLMAGPSNAGLTDPAHSAAISLGQLTTTLLLHEMTDLTDGDDETLFSQIGIGLGMQIVLELVDRVGDEFHRVHTEQELQQDEKEGLVRHVVELVASEGTIDVEAVAQDREVLADEVQDCLDEAAAQGLIDGTVRYAVTDRGESFIADEGD